MLILPLQSGGVCIPIIVLISMLCGFFWMEREKFVFWIWDKEHNNQTFQRVLLKCQLLDGVLVLYLFFMKGKSFWGVLVIGNYHGKQLTTYKRQHGNVE